eukprot:scaffold4944_cov209-Pinguiococcus_pyrenoidosus.AAC.8
MVLVLVPSLRLPLFCSIATATKGFHVAIQMSCVEVDVSALLDLSGHVTESNDAAKMGGFLGCLAAALPWRRVGRFEAPLFPPRTRRPVASGRKRSRPHQEDHTGPASCF